MRLKAATALFFALLTISQAAAALDPTGYLDVANCDVIAGWAQDPDEPIKSIDVHLYLGGAAGSGAPGLPTPANLYREDLCTAIGSCEHGFVMALPLSFFNGAAHDVFAYGIDSQGGNNPLLGNSPKAFQCPPVAVGVRRKLTVVSAADDWKFNSFWDLLPLPAAEAAVLAEGATLPAKPLLVQADDGSPALWLLDSGVRRAVAPSVIAAWRFDTQNVMSLPAAEMNAMVEGPPVRARPVLVMFEGLSLMDDVLPTVPGGGSGGGGGQGEGAGGGAGGNGGGDGGNANGGKGGGGNGGGGNGGNGGGGNGEVDSKGGCSVLPLGNGNKNVGGVAMGIIVAMFLGLRRRTQQW